MGRFLKRYFRPLSEKPLKVCVSGAAGQICYSLLFALARGQAFGPFQKIELRLLDIPQALNALKGVTMELEDCAFRLVSKLVPTIDPAVGFADCDIAVLVGGMPRRKGMLRADLLRENSKIFKAQGQALNKYASIDCKVLVVANPANTNCLIAQKFAPRIPKENFSALTRLDYNRAVGFIANKIGVSASQVHNVVIWGNHSKTQYPDISHGFIQRKSGICVPISSCIDDKKWLDSHFIPLVQQRGAEIIKARKFSSAASAAHAICDHLRTWMLGSLPRKVDSMAVATNGTYGVLPGLFFSFPVVCSRGGKYRIVNGFKHDTKAQRLLEKTEKELLSERSVAFSIL